MTLGAEGSSGAGSAADNAQGAFHELLTPNQLAILARLCTVSDRWTGGIMNQNEPASKWLSFMPRISWMLHDTTLYAIAVSDEARHHLIVEPLLTKKAWDWAVWKQGEPPETVRYGTASSALDAMTEAQVCALSSNRAFTDRGVAASNFRGGDTRAGGFFGPVSKPQGA
jgi:hypothetical protein